MLEYVAVSIGVLVAVAAAMSGCIFVIGTAQIIRGKSMGYLHYAPYAILLTVAIEILFSDRNLESLSGSLVQASERHPATMWTIRVVTILLMTFSLERVLNFWHNHKRALGRTSAVTSSYAVFWFGTVGITTLFSANPYFSHDYIYPLIIGWGVLTLSQDEGKLYILSLRNALLVFIAAGFIVIPFKPSLVVDTAYAQGYLPGLPRLSGLAAHAVALGFFSQLALMFLWAYPFSSRFLNRLGWLLGLTALILAQSKTAWISALICFVTIYLNNNGKTLWKRLNDPHKPQLAITIVASIVFVLMLLIAAFSFGNLEARFDKFLNSAAGEQLTSLTGRGLIWEVALKEWAKNPIFGYGPMFLDSSYRLSIGLPNAINAHNQFVDVVARSGLVGLATLLFYVAILFSYSKRYAGASRGLTMAIFLTLMFRAVSEVPLTLYGYGAELVAHFSLLALFIAHGTEHPSKRCGTQIEQQVSNCNATKPPC